MNKVWIDLTDISVWDGHHTGTQRLVYQIAKQFYGQPGVDYFTFDPKYKTFHQRSFQDILERVETAEKSMVGESAGVPQQSRARRLAATAYRDSPEFIRKHLTPRRRKRIKTILKKTKQIVRSSRSNTIKSSMPPMQFTASDTILIMGKPWDYPDLIETLRKHKLQHGFNLIQVVYDLIPVFLPHLFGTALFAPYTQHVFETAAISDGLLAISESTKRDMQKFCKDMLIDCPPISVIRLGDDFSRVATRKPRIDVSKGDFILCVGTIEVRKNHQLLYTTYKLGLSKGIKLPKLVIVGGKGWYTGDVIYEFGHDPNMRGLVYIMHHANDAELKWLYENCMFTIYPSVYEGWGLPIAESLSYGKMCISSETSSMPEVAGELIDYFSPYNTEECLKKIETYLDPHKLSDKERQIKQTYNPTTWQDTYKQVAGYLKELT